MVAGRFELDFVLVGAVTCVLKPNGYGKAETHSARLLPFTLKAQAVSDERNYA